MMIQLLPPSTSQRTDRILASVAFVLPGFVGVVVAFGAPSPARFIFIVAAILYGPATPAFRLACRMTWRECLGLGVGVDAALVMVTGQMMVMAHQWAPDAAVAGLLLSSIVVALPLLLRSVGGLEDQRP